MRATIEILEELLRSEVGKVQYLWNTVRGTMSDVPSNELSESSSSISSVPTAEVSTAGTEQLFVEIKVDSKTRMMNIATVGLRGT